MQDILPASASAPQVITPRGRPIDSEATAPFDARQIARDLLRTSRMAALATLDTQSGYPYGTMTNLSVEPDGLPVFYAAGLALHARNIIADPRVSLTLAQVNGLDILNERRLTLVGRAVPLAEAQLAVAISRYRRRFPKAVTYTALKDARFFRVEIEGIHLNGGPARNTDTLTPEDLRFDLSGAEDLMRHEEAEIARINADKRLIQPLSERAGGVRGRWKLTGIDPEGLDLAGEAAVARLWLPQRITSRAGLNAYIASIGGPTRL